MARIWATLIGYVFGNFLTAMIVGKIFLKINPTEYGSHNPGTATWVLFLVKNGVF